MQQGPLRRVKDPLLSVGLGSGRVVGDRGDSLPTALDTHG